MRRLLALSAVFAVLSFPVLASAQRPLDAIAEDAEKAADADDDDEDDETAGDEEQDDENMESDDPIVRPQLEPPVLDPPERLGTHETRFGAVAGPALSYITTDDADLEGISDPIFRYTLGLHVEYTYQGAFGAAVEGLFTRRGWHTRGTALGEAVDTTYAISYIDIPVLFRSRLPTGGRIAPQLMVGPHASLFVDGDRGGTQSDLFFDGDGPDIDDEDVPDVQFGLTIGVGLEAYLPPGTGTVSVRYMHNFTRVFEDPAGADNVYHRTFLVMVGFLF